ncbi:hypothetical protein [Pedobacter xixiisoli]|uniref:VWA domain-containing protein n=1 Tax=Pedobacter xixiisoli TaxID=1476464 RepID=A0A286A8C9_9SPHI|nr:hypothetical protein [Pedobacter xixiisoli]SOD18170.1 hypothetical protein SAMN06297358_2862 [Pedobacter xixiisoli]
MTSFFSFSTLIILLACLALGAGYAWVLYGANKNLDKKLRSALAATRTLTVAALVFLLLAPLVRRISHTPEKPVIVIANDNSISVKAIQPSGFDAKKYEQDLRQLADKLSEKYEVKTYSFGDSVKQGLSFTGTAQISNGTALVNQLNDELLNRNVGAIIMASDGIFNRGGNPIYELNKIKAPVYTIAMGDTIPKRDVLVANVNYNNIVYLDNEFTLDVQVQAFESKGENVKLAVLENGKQVAEQSLAIGSTSFVKDAQIKLKANKVGVHRYTVNVSTVKNEITTKNNSQTIFVEVIDGRQKVLLASAIPHPDLATFKQAIELNKHYEVSTAIAEELERVDVYKYNLVILYQLPAANYSATSLINKIKQQKISAWFVLGAQTNLQSFNQIQTQINFTRPNGSLQEVFPYDEKNFTAYNLNKDALKQLDSYDPLQIPFANMMIKGNYTAVLNQRIGKVNTQSPLLFFAEEDGRKLGFLIGEGIWKWKLEEAKNENSYPLVAELISKTVQYLAVKDDKRKFKVYTNKSTFEENENVLLNATLYNDAFEPVNASEVKIQIKNSEGKAYHYTFSKVGNAYQLDAGALPQGNYTYAASTSLGDKKYIANGAFYVNAIITEYQQTTANHQLLNTIAQQTKGKIYMPTNLLNIVDDLEKSGQVKTITYEDRRYEEMINLKWIFAVILVFLTVEWFFRKRNGEA